MPTPGITSSLWSGRGPDGPASIDPAGRSSSSCHSIAFLTDGSSRSGAFCRLAGWYAGARTGDGDVGPTRRERNLLRLRDTGGGSRNAYSVPSLIISSSKWSCGECILFVADTCFGGGLTRDIDPRSEEMSFRQVPSYRLSTDLLQPVTTAADELMTELDFDRTAFLAAVDRKTKAPEVQIPGIAGLRGALSYAVARAVEGNADTHGDGKITLKELFGNIRQVVYQLSNERQNIVTMASPSQDLNAEVVFRMVRSVSIDTPHSLPDSGASSSLRRLATIVRSKSHHWMATLPILPGLQRNRRILK